MYNLLGRTSEPVLTACRENDVAFVPFFPLGSAFAGARRVTDHGAVIAAAESLGATPAQIGLAWLLARAPEVLLIPGTADVGHLASNMAAGDIVLDAATMAGLDAADL